MLQCIVTECHAFLSVAPPIYITCLIFIKHPHLFMLIKTVNINACTWPGKFPCVILFRFRFVLPVITVDGLYWSGRTDSYIQYDVTVCTIFLLQFLYTSTRNILVFTV